MNSCGALLLTLLVPALQAGGEAAHRTQRIASNAAAIPGLSPGVRPLLTSHVGDVAAVGAHPSAAGAFWTVGADRRLIAWIAAAEPAPSREDDLFDDSVAAAARAVSVHPLPEAATAVAVSCAALGHIAVGFVDGSIRVYALRSMSEVLPSVGPRSALEPRDEVRFTGLKAACLRLFR